MILISGCIENSFAPDEKNGNEVDQTKNILGSWGDLSPDLPRFPVPIESIEHLYNDSTYIRHQFNKDGTAYSASNSARLIAPRHKKGEWRAMRDTVFILWDECYFWDQTENCPQNIQSFVFKIKSDTMRIDWLFNGGAERVLVKIDSMPKPYYWPDSLAWP